MVPAGLDEPFESYHVQNTTFDTPPMIVHVPYNPAAECLPGEAGYALVGCVVAPGFEFDDFELSED